MFLLTFERVVLFQFSEKFWASAKYRHNDETDPAARDSSMMRRRRRRGVYYHR